MYSRQMKLRLITDIFLIAHPMAYSEYNFNQRLSHQRSGILPTQEVAFTLASALNYIDSVLETGLDIDDFAQGYHFSFNCHNDFFEEIAKFRAAKSLHDLVEQRYKPNNPNQRYDFTPRWPALV